MVTVFVLLTFYITLNMGLRSPATEWDSIVHVKLKKTQKKLKSQVILIRITYKRTIQGLDQRV